jgi:phosphoribosylanthranilate isomerase
MLTLERAAAVLAEVSGSVRRVGVFADQSVTDIARAADMLELDVIQLHAAAHPGRIMALRERVDAHVWPVVRISGEHLPANISEFLDAADGLLLDAFVSGSLGGNGVTLPWSALAKEIQRIRGDKPIILAGGLRPGNVSEAIAALAPDVVDVSSGVESAPGIKDHEQMRAFRDAVTQASIST